MTQLPVLLLLNAGLICHLCVSQIFNSVPVSFLVASGTLSLSVKDTGIPAALTSEASQVATPLSTVAVCYNTINTMYSTNNLCTLL
jgi:hypothetical protein